MNGYRITPNDLLFFRDGRPMETGEGSGGHGARWPFPTVFFDALHAALHRAFPEAEGLRDWEHSHKGRHHNGHGRTGPQRFGSLHTAGPFPCLPDGSWQFPAPRDARPDGAGAAAALRPLKTARGTSNLPAPLCYPLGNPHPPTKDEIISWWNRETLTSYLANGKTGLLAGHHQDQLFDSEWTTGIGTDPGRDTQDGERIYTAEYLRLKPEVTMACAAELPVQQADGLEHLFPRSGAIICGGQQRVCHVERNDQSLAEVLPASSPVDGDGVKWMLLTPAIFSKSNDHPGGWLPSWVSPETGAVRLPKEKPPRQPGESRAAWRQRIRQACEAAPLDVRLVAAAVGKPEVVTGWSDYLTSPDGKRAAGGKVTRLAVPAGSVYYFEGSDAPLLAKLLSWDCHGADSVTPRSGSMGEKGLGIGVTGPWAPY